MNSNIAFIKTYRRLFPFTYSHIHMLTINRMSASACHFVCVTNTLYETLDARHWVNRSPNGRFGVALTGWQLVAVSAPMSASMMQRIDIIKWRYLVNIHSRRRSCARERQVRRLFRKFCTANETKWMTTAKTTAAKIFKQHGPELTLKQGKPKDRSVRRLAKSDAW